jgi:hypothetical protein
MTMLQVVEHLADTVDHGGAIGTSRRALALIYKIFMVVVSKPFRGGKAVPATEVERSGRDVQDHLTTRL